MTNKNVYHDEKGSNDLDKTIAYFKIKDDFSIDKFYNTDYKPLFQGELQDKEDNGKVSNDKLCFDISNMYKENNKCDKYFILVAISRINIDKNMKKNEGNNFDATKGIVIYRLELERKVTKEKESYELGAVARYYCNEKSGLCRFVEFSRKAYSNDDEQERLAILNFHGIHIIDFDNNCDFFHLNEMFRYSTSIRRELDDWYSTENCIKRLHSCIYDKYFLVTQYKNDVQSLEVYNLATMELETTAKIVEKMDEFINDNYVFSINNLQLCISQGNNIIRLYYRENGLQIVSKEFCEIEKILTLEFFDNDDKLLIIGERTMKGEKEPTCIIWDLYNTGKHDNGTVSLVLKKVEKKLHEQKELQQQKKEEVAYILKKDKRKKPNGSPDNNYNERYDENIENFEAINKEPWVLNSYDRISYCIYYNIKGTRTETLNLIVNRFTVQIWHQIQDSENRDDLPNKGEPFLEYIWINRIPINQERYETRLRIEEFKYGLNDGLHEKLSDFYLKTYWYERKENEENIKKEEHAKREDHELTITEEEDKEIYEIQQSLMEINENKKMNKDEKEQRKREIIEKSVKVKRCEKVIKRNNIIGKLHVVRHACKALEHLNRRYKSKRLANSYVRIHKYNKMISYIQHIVWRFAKYEPENFKSLDFQYNVMKNLILGDCDRLIKFILFGDEESVEKEEKGKNKSEKENGINEVVIRHIPRNKLWPRKSFLMDDDLDFDERDIWMKDNEKIVPKNNMELAIYHCKGREFKDTIIIAYLLEYYSRHATDSDHFSAPDPNEIIPTECQKRRNHDIKFRAFRPIVKLKSDKDAWYDLWIRKPPKHFKNCIITTFENLDNDLGKSPLALRVVPLPSFTINNFKRKKIEYNWLKIILNLIFFIFLPRWYQIGRRDRGKLSPFSRMVLYENSDDIYDNPAIRAIINFCWEMTRYFFFSLFLRFLILIICFGLISWAYLNHTIIINGKFLYGLIITFYYLAIYRLITEVFQFNYRGVKNYFGDIYNIFDIISIVFSVTVMSMMLRNYQFSDGFGSVSGIEETDNRIQQTNLIADYEALYQIHFWDPEPEPNHIYYFGESKTLEEWRNARKKDQGAIFEDLEEKSTFANRIFKEKDYDNHSILVYNLIPRSKSKILRLP
ncbi:hypothetical protein GLOIN_2v1769896 [Rhizophagus clarus]|uniref:Ion transport domain-containing protein n=1 Tax=Rhizophagus clarus TaxID=94130 RepID=A0A8H3LSQ2_9GLOM|nr:hypothetical protein GLOIN_2v1769896 [Rhizophagus clarus]